MINTYRMYLKVIIFILTGFSISLYGQGKLSVSGFVKDANTGETLTGAAVYIKSESNLGASTNTYGFYTLRLTPGDYTIVFAYLGYADQERKVSLTKDLSLNIDLSEGVEMGEVVIEAEAADKNVSGTQMGEIILPIEKIQKIPALMGEVDLLKALQLLPGVQSAGEGSSGFFVRGVDQIKIWYFWMRHWFTILDIYLVFSPYLIQMPSNLPILSKVECLHNMGEDYLL